MDLLCLFSSLGAYDSSLSLRYVILLIRKQKYRINCYFSKIKTFFLFFSWRMIVTFPPFCYTRQFYSNHTEYDKHLQHKFHKIYSVFYKNTFI